jgi:hypothetical protein
MTSTVKVYVRLKDEGTDCWRPVTAEKETASVCRILSVQPKDEVWEFPTGSRVRCVEKHIGEGSWLVALEEVT